MPPHRLAPALLVALLLSGCKEMEEAFEHDDQLDRTKREREAGERAAEIARQNQARLAAQMEAASADQLGPEPVERGERVRWLIRTRIGCSDAACSQDTLHKLRDLGDISAELRPLLDRDDESTRAEALRLVGLLKLEGLELRLVSALTDRSAAVRRAACHALEWLGDPAAAVGIVKHLRERREDHLCLLGALGAMPGTVAITALSRDATGEDAVIASSAVHALEKRKSDDAVRVLEEAIALSPFPEVKRHAVEALAAIPSKVAKAALARAAKSRDPAVRGFVKQARVN